ncbi:hypothetical protein BCR44DRAFT_57350 [Catenaria anguillulae PL171]|uniref:Uncharacterized protein n=1 Tax=Catenaria anguillulae PL171 TaxID=765915 RepID=A0A1Y2HRR0_9FUNG|nr:hypothetical protein BCR44DRAFT_57350 [Catenaria anguillulae PL171]
MANERCVKQAVALIEVVLGCEGPKIVAYAPAAPGAASLSVSGTLCRRWGLLACNRATAIPAGGAAGCKNDKVWAKVAAVADAQTRDAFASMPVDDTMDTQTMQLALTLLQYPSVLRRCLVSAESAPLATYAMRVAGVVGKQKKGTQSLAEVERVAAKVVGHAVWVLGGKDLY